MSNKSVGRKFKNMDNIEYYINMGATVSGIKNKIEKNNMCPYQNYSIPIGMERIINGETRQR